MEATSHASVQGRLDGVRFAVLVFTNLAHEHLDFHGTMEEYFAAKRRLFAQAEHAVVNVGDPWGRRLAAELDDRDHFDADRDALDADLKLRGRFNLENALGAAAAARALGHRRGRDPRRHRSGRRRSRPAGVRGRGAAVRGDRRLRAQAGVARARAARGAAARATAASSASSAAAATAIARSVR